MTKASVQITTNAGSRTYHIKSGGNPEHVRDVLSRALELGCALLDGVYSRSDSEGELGAVEGEKESDGMDPQ